MLISCIVILIYYHIIFIASADKINSTYPVGNSCWGTPRYQLLITFTDWQLPSIIGHRIFSLLALVVCRQTGKSCIKASFWLTFTICHMTTSTHPNPRNRIQFELKEYKKCILILIHRVPAHSTPSSFHSLLQKNIVTRVCSRHNSNLEFITIYLTTAIATN